MNYKFIITLLMLLPGAGSMIAQIIEPKEDAIIQISYDKTVSYDTVGGTYSPTSPMGLRIGKTSSMFYPEKRMFVDSMDLYAPDVRLISFEEILRDGGKAFIRLEGTEDEYLFRNVHDGETMACQSISTYHIGYTEKTELPEWTVRNDTTERVLGYECLYATCSFHGRDWEAWFTPEIPLNEGPWKLAGLPGLVLKANDTRKHYVFEAKSIRTEALPPVGIFIYKQRPVEMLKDRKTYLNKVYNLDLKAKFMDDIPLYTDFKPSKRDKIPKYDLEETDYPH